MSDYSIKKGVLVVEKGVTELPRNPWAYGGIGKGFFQGNMDIIEAKLPTTLKSIGDWAFRDCKNLKSIEIPESVTKLEHLVFSGCYSLEEISVPDSVTKMQTSDFEDCKNLKKVKISKKIKEIQRRTFFGCESLEQIQLSDNLKAYGEYCFAGCRSLKELKITKKVENIDCTAFNDCSGLEKITVDENNEMYNSVPGSNAVFLGKKLILGCKETVIPKGTTCIGTNAFAGCTGLKTINVPEGVVDIEDNAFLNCSNLEEIYLPATLKEINNCFDGCNKLNKIHINKKNKKIVSGNKENVLIANKKLVYFYGTTIPSNEDFDEIGEYAIKKPGISELIIPEGVKKLGKLVFYTEETTKVSKDGCKYLDVKEFPLKKLSIPSTLEAIEKDAFEGSIEDIDEIVVSKKNKKFDSRNDCHAIINTKDNTLILACKNTIIPEGVVVINGKLVSKNRLKELIIPRSVKQLATLGRCQFDELIFKGDDIIIGYEAWKDYWHNPFETNNIKAKKIKGSKTILEKIKKSYEMAADKPKFIEI